MNYGGVSDREIDGLLLRMRRALAPVERADLASTLADRLAVVWPIVPLTSPDPFGLVHLRVRGVRVWNGWITLRDLSLASDRVDE